MIGTEDSFTLIAFSLSVFALAMACGCQCMQMTRKMPSLRLPRLRRGGKGARMRPVPTQASDDEEEGSLPSTSRDEVQPTSATETVQVQVEVQLLHKKVKELENALAALRVHLENANSAERSARVDHAASMSRLLDETCAVLQWELASEKKARKDAVSAIRHELSSTGALAA